MRSRAQSVHFSYRELTSSTYHAIKLLMEESAKRDGAPGLQRKDWAYGMYLGWRALVMDRIPPTIFHLDDRAIEALLAGRPPLAQ